MMLIHDDVTHGLGRYYRVENILARRSFDVGTHIISQAAEISASTNWLEPYSSVLSSFGGWLRNMHQVHAIDAMAALVSKIIIQQPTLKNH